MASCRSLRSGKIDKSRRLSLSLSHIRAGRDAEELLYGYDLENKACNVSYGEWKNAGKRLESLFGPSGGKIKVDCISLRLGLKMLRLWLL